ncbi:hypothetical protein ACFLT2_13785 [Acidobacteriota bacterium]
MASRLKKNVRKIPTFLIILGLLFSFSVIDLQAGRCESAFNRCMWEVGFVSPHYCGAGWVFCKKYIE